MRTRRTDYGRLGVLMAALLTTEPVIVSAAGAATGPATRPAAASAPSRQALIRRMIRQLDDDDFDVRSAASLRLNSLGGEALPAVRAALDGQMVSPEAAIRLRAALKYVEPRARREAAYREHRAYVVAQWHAAYNGGGHANPAYDADVHRGIDLFGRDQDAAAAVVAFRAAADKGCDDPLARSLHHLATGKNFGEGEGVVGAGLLTTTRQTMGGSYPPIVKSWLILATTCVLRHADPVMLRRAADLLAEAVKSPGLPRAEIGIGAARFSDTLAALGQDTWGGGLMLAAALEEAAPGTADALAVKGEVMIDQAWAARGNGGASTVTPDRAKLFAERLAQAEDALERAWKLDPTDARAATRMITVKLGQGEAGGGRQAMETWFARAMDADPDNLPACSKKLYYLYPRWYGSHDEMVRFGRDCLATQNWRGGIPYVLIDAHDAVAQETDDAKAYYEREDVWADFAAVYEGALLNFPDDDYRRSQYATFAARAGRWDVARAQLERLSDRAVLSVFGGKSTLDYYRKKAARLGKVSDPPGLESRN
jgi:hypothetical protein